MSKFKPRCTLCKGTCHNSKLPKLRPLEDLTKGMKLIDLSFVIKLRNLSKSVHTRLQNA